MSSVDQRTDQIIPPPPSSPNITLFDLVKERIIFPTILAGVAGGGVGSISRHRKALGLSKSAAVYASNFAIVTGCYCVTCEFLRLSRTGKPDDLMNSAVGGFVSGAVLGRLQGGRAGAIRYSVIFAVVGTTIDYSVMKLKPVISELRTKAGSELKLPEWSPIQVLDEEAVAAKQAREQKLFKNVHSLSKEES